jgi:hypothetical protein
VVDQHQRQQPMHLRLVGASAKRASRPGRIASAARSMRPG